jgi:acyl-coenzyme A thioesterase PaaI-like protein
VKFLRRLNAGEKYRAEGRLVSLTRRLGFAEGDIRDESGVLYALASSTCRILN